MVRHLDTACWIESEKRQREKKEEKALRKMDGVAYDAGKNLRTYKREKSSLTDFARATGDITITGVYIVD